MSSFVENNRPERLILPIIESYIIYLLTLLATQLLTNFNDKRWFNEGKNRHFKCAKDLSAAIPTDIFDSCTSLSYDFEESSLENVVKNLCKDFQSVLEWSFSDCNKKERNKSSASGRAAAQKRKTKNVCRRISRRFQKENNYWKNIFDDESLLPIDQLMFDCKVYYCLIS